MSGKQLKYVRTAAGFSICPSLTGMFQHPHLEAAVCLPPISAGVIEWDYDGRPLCMGDSSSLGIASREDDTEALRAEWGMTAPVPVAGEFGPPVRAVAIVVEQLDGNEARISWMFNPVPAGQELLWDHKDGLPAPVVLNPAALADAQKFGQGLSEESLEHGEPVL